MNNLFKKNIEKSEMVQSPEVKIISAEEALTVSASKWNNVSTEKIFEKINSEAQYGETRVYLWNVEITEEQKQYLENLGYTVKILTRFDTKSPYVKVSW